MSLKDLLALADDKLADVFNTKGYDPTKDRAKHVKAIDSDIASYGNPEPTRGRKAWKASNNVVEYTSRFPISGKTTHYVPSERFGDFLSKLKNLVETGSFDSDFEAAAKGDATAAKTPRKKREPGTGGAGWSDERRAAYNASIAARKAAKENA
ncbi:hypothetical protein [uncultured Sphingomonas sp.]|uniref:hypothetical protein n=1 Tax=uncultured Sphingomonas sp. TaxID=158754 RepID=UPI002629B06F|nr:hypothetical protein [uncultured Sphingomonas sp.]